MTRFISADTEAAAYSVLNPDNWLTFAPSALHPSRSGPRGRDAANGTHSSLADDVEDMFMAEITNPTVRLENVQTLLDRIEKSDAIIGIVGLGYVGLPLAQAIARKGFSILGFDNDPTKVEMLAVGRSYIHHISSESIAELYRDGRFSATDDFTRLGEPDAILMCVPTPLNKYREPDLSYVENTTRQIARHLRRNQLIVLESTTYPGTCTEVMLPILEAGGLKSGKDFFVAYSPEREDPGNPQYGTASIPKVVGGAGPDALRLAVALYDKVVVRTVPVSSTETAEAVKLTENIFRSVNIALVNELKVIYSAMGVDVWEVIEAARSKPFGFMPFYPGPGLGGHCIPIDPFYLTWKAREYNVATRFIELAGEVNTNMPRYVVEKLVEALDARQRRGLNGSRILLIGMAYKKNVDDIRESPSLRLMEMLEARGAEVEFYDPYIAEIPRTREYPQLMGRKSVAWSVDTLREFHAALIATDHDNIDYSELTQAVPLVVDTRNACQRNGVPGENVVKA